MYSDEYNNEEMNQGYDETNNIENDYNNNNNGSSNKKILWIIIAAIILVIIVILYLWLGRGDNNTDPKPSVPQLTINTQQENLTLGTSLPLKANVDNVPNAIFSWTSSDENVATVDSMGNVTGVNYGKTMIIATYLHTDNVSYNIACEVTVSDGDPNIPVTDVKFPEGEILISEGGKYDLKVIIEPTNGYITNLDYTSGDESIATINKNGEILAIKEGKTDIRLNVNDGDFTDQITVNVTKKQVNSQLFFPVDSITFNKPLLILEVGADPVPLSFEIKPSNALSDNLVWESSDPTVVSVNQGIVSPLKVGKADITVRSIDGVPGMMTIEVIEKNIPVSGIEILNNSTTDANYDEKTKTFSLKVNESAQILASVKPDDATNKDVIYKSDKETVATVNENGYINAVGKGTATITISSKENSKLTEKIIVNVTSSSSYNPGTTSIKVKEIKPLSSFVTVANGSTISITPTISPSNASNKNIECISSDTSIVAASGNGGTCNVTGKKEGSTKVTLKAKDGSGVTAIINVSVKSELINNVSSSYSVKIEESILIAPTLSNNLRVTSCEIADKSIAKASNIGGDCSVIGVKKGKTTLTITATGGGQTATKTTEINVTNSTTSVNETIAGIFASPSSITMEVNESKNIIITTTPTNITNKIITCSSSNGGAVVVDSYNQTSCVVSGRIGGSSAIITIKDGISGKSTTVNVTVNKSNNGGNDYNCTTESVTSCFPQGVVGDAQYTTCSLSKTMYTFSVYRRCAWAQPSSWNPNERYTDNIRYESQSAAINACNDKKLNFSCVLSTPFASECSTQKIEYYDKQTCTKKSQ